MGPMGPMCPRALWALCAYGPYGPNGPYMIIPPQGRLGQERLPLLRLSRIETYYESSHTSQDPGNFVFEHVLGHSAGVGIFFHNSYSYGSLAGGKR